MFIPTIKQEKMKNFFISIAAKINLKLNDKIFVNLNKKSPL